MKTLLMLIGLALTGIAYGQQTKTHLADSSKAYMLRIVKSSTSGQMPVVGTEIADPMAFNPLMVMDDPAQKALVNQSSQLLKFHNYPASKNHLNFFKPKSMEREGSSSSRQSADGF